MEATYDNFMTYMYSLNPMGSAEVYYDMLKDIIVSNASLYDGTPITFDVLIKRYSEYINYLKPYNNVEDKDKRYIKKEHVIQPIGTWLVQKLYMNDYASKQGTPNDNYLFGL